MALKFQYNKTSLHGLDKQLKMRVTALPTLKNKESALRIEVRKAKDYAEKLLEELNTQVDKYDYISALWNEFDASLIEIKDIDLEVVKIAGVKTPHLKGIHYSIKEFNAFAKPVWFADGVKVLQEISKLGIESEVYLEKSRILSYNRKKTTQKVNLYEKVQIPGFKEAIRKIKRYLEDEENLSKAASKIVKTKHQAEEAMEGLYHD